jgi:hypothetical protein
MKTLYIITHILAIALHSLRISPLLIRIATIALLYAAALLISVVYIQSIGSGIGIFSGLFYMPELEISNWLLLSSPSSEGGWLAHHLLISSLLPVKPKRLTNLEKQQFSLSEELKQILVGLLLGDLYAYKECVNAKLRFKQGAIHKEYLFHLFELFSSYCPSGCKTTNAAPDKRTGKVYEGIYFNTYSLPCFAEFYDLFYPEGKKVVPYNIGELLTPLSLAYWICDDGTFVSGRNITYLCTESFLESDVDSLLSVLSDKFGLKCRKDKRGNGFRIVIPKSSLGKLRELVLPYLHSSMLYKIGL